MTIKFIALDMDGTLLTSENKILPATKELLIKLQTQGIRLVLASGRSYTRLMPYAKELKMDIYGGYFVEINGGARYDLTSGEREVLAQISIPQAHALFTYFSKWNVEIIGQMDEGMYDYNPPAILEEKTKWRKQHQLPDDFPWTGGAYDFIADTRNGYPNISYIHNKEGILTTVNKVSVTYWEDVMKEVRIQAEKDLSSRFWLGMASEKWLEVMPRNVTKAQGLRMLAKKHNIHPDEIIAFGDGENDIEMLQYVKYGIAMGNALQNVKEIAYDVTDTNNDGGIEKALRKILGIRA